MLAACCTGSEVGSKAETDQGDSLTVDIVTSKGIVEDRGDDVLPVGADRLPLLGQHSSLAGTIEREHVVAASQRGRSVRDIQLLSGGY